MAGQPLSSNKPDALWGQFLQLRALRRAMSNNSPEMPVTRVCEAGGANRSNFRPGYEVRMITGESSVQPAMVVAWMRRPTDRPSRHAYCKEKTRHHYKCAFSLSLWQCGLSSLPLNHIKGFEGSSIGLVLHSIDRFWKMRRTLADSQSDL